MTSQYKLYNQIKESLYKQFKKEFPPLPSDKAITTDKSQVLDEFHKWYNFWDSKDPKITDKNFDFQNNNNQLLLLKKQICGERKIAILKKLESLGLSKEFIESNIRNGII
jgi:hypothetical protein